MHIHSIHGHELLECFRYDNVRLKYMKNRGKKYDSLF